MNSYYGYNGLNWLMAAGSASVVLLVIAFIAAIVLTVIVYREYISGYGSKTVSFKDKSTWGPFFRFETFLVDKVLKALYIFAAIFTATAACAGVIIAIIAAAGVGSYNGSYGIAAFFTILLSDVVSFIIFEFLARIGYELQIMFITLCQNTTAIRNKVVGVQVDTRPNRPVSRWAMPRQAPAVPVNGAPYNAAQAAPTSPQAQPVAPTAPQTAPAPAAGPAATAPAPAPAAAPTPATAPKPASDEAEWTCPACGKTGNKGKFCGSCGAKRP